MTGRGGGREMLISKRHLRQKTVFHSGVCISQQVEQDVCSAVIFLELCKLGTGKNKATCVIALVIARSPYTTCNCPR